MGVHTDNFQTKALGREYYCEIKIFRSGLLSGVKKSDFVIGR